MPSSQITEQDVNQAIIEYDRDPKKFADRDDKYTLVVNNRSYPPRIIYALAKSIAAGEKVFSKKEITRGVSASFARNELSNLKLTIVPINDPKCEAIASRFVTNPSFERLRRGSKIYKARLVSFGPACYIGFKFSEQGKGSPKPGLAIYVKKGHGKKQDFIKEFVSFKKDFFKFNDKQASESENTGWVSFCRDDCNSLDDAYNQIVDPGTKRNEWLQFFNDLVEKVKDFVKLGSDPFKTPTELLPPGEHKQELPLKGTDAKILPRNLIWFGAPGTGKSHDAKAKIGEYFANAKKTDDSIRTTFHPDSDYASFVGSYKPSMFSTSDNETRVYDTSALIQKLKKMKELTYPCQRFGARYWKSLVNLDETAIKAIIKACGFKGKKGGDAKSLSSEVRKGMAVGQDLSNDAAGGKIVYAFSPQAFTKAYVKAWEKMAENSQTPERQYLVIEEINRGNCAQIFGDLFQLLDRDTVGYSKYPIDPDADLGQYLGEWFPDNGVTKDNTSEHLPFEDTKETTTWGDVLSGRKLVLPPNLYIWATMNTSDQSLFPMDSAFKRRWEWKYSKIKDEGKNYRILDGGKEGFVWWEFLEKINAIIRNVTQSADKQLGYFFVKLPDDLPEDKRIIDAETFVNKVIFYLWNDVFRDCELDDDAFMVEDKDEKDSGNNTNSKRLLTFDDFFEDDGGVKEKVVTDFLSNLLPKNTENRGTGETAPNQGEVPVSGSVSPGATTPEQ